MDQTGITRPEDLTWFTFSTASEIDPDPTHGHQGAKVKDFMSYPSSFGTSGGITFAEFEISGFTGGGVGAYNTYLPVELADFNGFEEEHSILLNWTTYSEQNSDQFIIERMDEDGQFSPIGSVAASGNSVTPKRYQFMDHYPVQGDNYYRLKQIDQDGTFAYSNIIMVEYSGSKGLTVLSSNPVNGPIKLGINWSHNEPASIYVTSSDGRMMYRELLDLTRGTNEVILNSEELGSGIYFIHLEGANFIDVVKIVVMN